MFGLDKIPLVLDSKKSLSKSAKVGNIFKGQGLTCQRGPVGVMCAKDLGKGTAASVIEHPL